MGLMQGAPMCGGKGIQQEDGTWINPYNEAAKAGEYRQEPLPETENK